MTEVTTLMVPKKLAAEIKSIAAKQYPPKKWSDLSRDVLYGYVAMHRARGQLDE